jgi:hypothetical protein
MAKDAPTSAFPPPKFRGQGIDIENGEARASLLDAQA